MGLETGKRLHGAGRASKVHHISARRSNGTSESARKGLRTISGKKGEDPGTADVSSDRPEQNGFLRQKTEAHFEEEKNSEGQLFVT
jgi:hypothetical protein